MAGKLLVEWRRVVGRQAPTRTTMGGRVVATTRARPYAPPRRVTGDLYRSASIVRTKNGARFVIWRRYSVPLEYGEKVKGFPHKHLAVAMKNLGIKGRHSVGRR